MQNPVAGSIQNVRQSIQNVRQSLPLHKKSTVITLHIVPPTLTAILGGRKKEQDAKTDRKGSAQSDFSRNRAKAKANANKRRLNERSGKGDVKAGNTNQTNAANVNEIEMTPYGPKPPVETFAKGEKMLVKTYVPR